MQTVPSDMIIEPLNIEETEKRIITDVLDNRNELSLIELEANPSLIKFKNKNHEKI